MMQLYVDKSGSAHVGVDQSAASVMFSLCHQANGLETGGILVGSYSPDGAVAQVDEALEAPEGSESTPFDFLRGCCGMRETLRQMWGLHQHYVGEWHFHPHGSARPSPRDRRQMAEIGEDALYQCPRPILIVISGNANDWNLDVWVHSDGELVQFVKRSCASTGL